MNSDYIMIGGGAVAPGGPEFERQLSRHTFFCCEFFVFREEDQAAAAVAYTFGKWRSRRYSDVPIAWRQQPTTET